MHSIRGRFLRDLEEQVVVRRENPQRRSGEDEFIYPIPPKDGSPVKAAILPYRGDADLGDVITTNYSYRCNFVPPHPEIRVDDEVVRYVGQGAREKVLTTKQVTTVEGVQSLILQDKVGTIV